MNTSIPSSSSEVATHVLVIGAGMSGLAAARRLHDQGHRVTVIEARDRIGGRTWSSTAWQGVPLDMGASWIHGVTDNPLTELAQQVGAQTVVTDLADITLHSWRGGVASDEVKGALQGWASTIATALADFGESSEVDRSIREVAHASVDYAALGADDKAYVSSALNDYEQEYAGSTARLSAFYFDDDAELEGGDVLFPGGYGQLTAHLAEGLTIKTGQPVTDVDWDDSGVTVTTEAEVHHGSHVVVTLPLGVLKSGSVRFGQALPAEKSAAISNLGVGLLDKCYLEFPEVFWAGTDWLVHVPEASDAGHWAQWVNMHRAVGKPILLGFNAADVGIQMETLNDEQIVAAAMKTLRTMYGPTIPEPTRHQITRWMTDPYAHGSYSFYAVGSTPGMRGDLGAALDTRVFFAGEATSQSSPSTVRGAYESGLRAANDIHASLA